MSNIVSNVGAARMLVAVAGLLPLVAALLSAATPEQAAQARRAVTVALEQLTPAYDATFGFSRATERLGHGPRPWSTWKRRSAGAFMLADNGATFFQRDSTAYRDTFLTAYGFRCDTMAAEFGYGRHQPAGATQSDLRDAPLRLATLTPVFLLRDYLAREDAVLMRYTSGATDTIVYRFDAGRIVTLTLESAGHRVLTVSAMYHHDLYGDMVRTIAYSNYRAVPGGGFEFPGTIVETELGIRTSSADVVVAVLPFDRERVLELLPSGHTLGADPDPEPQQVTHTRLNDRLHLLELRREAIYSLVVEFEDFLLVAEAPLASENGETILEHVQNISNKPVRYFAFSHHHPHYLGGVRPFVHHGAVILSPSMDTPYVRQIVTRPRTLMPDRLSIDPKPLRLATFDSDTTIADGSLRMQIIRIGDASVHADDYLIYYFPQYRLLFDAELGWIPAEAPPKPAGDRARGLYAAITERGLEVDTIVQTWPTRGYDVKSRYAFEELRNAVEMER